MHAPIVSWNDAIAPLPSACPGCLSPQYPLANRVWQKTTSPWGEIRTFLRVCHQSFTRRRWQASLHRRPDRRGVRPGLYQTTTHHHLKPELTVGFVLLVPLVR